MAIRTTTANLWAKATKAAAPKAAAATGICSVCEVASSRAEALARARGPMPPAEPSSPPISPLAPPLPPPPQPLPLVVAAAAATGEAFVACNSFAGACSGYGFKLGELGLGYYKFDGITGKRKREATPEPVAPTIPSIPTQPPPNTVPAAAGVSEPRSPIRPPSPPVRLPQPGTSETLCYRRSRPVQQSSRRLPVKWALSSQSSAAPAATATLIVTTTTATAATVARTATTTTPAPMQQTPQIDTDTLLAEQTKGTVPGSREWVQALRDSVTVSSAAVTSVDGNAALDSLAAVWRQRGNNLGADFALAWKRPGS